MRQPKKDENFEVYPNPSTGQYNVEIPSNMIGTKFEVMSLDGKTILKESINNKTNFQFEIANQPQGIYILNIVDEAGDQHIFRLIKE